MLYDNAFIDLPDISLPFTHSDLLEDQDYEILETKHVPPEGVKTSKVFWGVGLKKRGVIKVKPSNSDVSLMGFIFDKDMMYAMKEHFDKTYNTDILGDIQLQPHGKSFFPVSLITFTGNTPWHREGFPYEWSSKEFEKSYHSFSPNSRYNFAVNYPLYVKDAEKTKVEFAKTKKPIQHLEKRLMMQLMKNNSDHGYIESQGLRVSKALNQITDVNLWKKDIDITATKYGYDCPYIINLSSYHKVTTTNATRLSLRYMASNKYQWSDIEDLYNTGKLLKNA
tara:strand:- start:58 stop:897 length:840 start_codon:yes stop_codon:yes gene_type:complete